MSKQIATALAVALLSLLLHGCAPGAFAPGPGYGSGAVSTGIYPPSTRAGHFDEDGFYISSGPAGIGLEVAEGPWRGGLFAYQGVTLRTSYSKDDFGVSLDATYNTGYREEYSSDTGYYDYVPYNIAGVALDGTYYIKVPTDLGSAYVGPRLRAYFACVSEEGGPYDCYEHGVLPGGTIGINFHVGKGLERLTFGVEGSLFVVIPGVTNESRFGVFSPFAFSVSYRF